MKVQNQETLTPTKSIFQLKLILHYDVFKLVTISNFVEQRLYKDTLLSRYLRKHLQDIQALSPFQT